MSNRIPRKRKRKIQMKALVFAIAGAEPPRLVYRGREGSNKFERPTHTPFRGLAD